MQRMAIVAMFVGAVLLGEGTARAQAKQGDSEVLIFGSVTTSIQKIPDFFTGDVIRTTTSSGNFFFNVGRFVTDRFQLGGGPSFNVSTSQGETSTDMGVNAFTRLYFGATQSKVKPYVGAEYSVVSLNVPEGQSISDFQYLNANFGVKNYFSERAAIDFLGAYGFNPSHASDLQQFTFRIGLTVLF
jgi:hypothetical protein